jgi:pyridoxal 5'-phosphate synthase pdxT subunit
MPPTVGVLALQGDFEEHALALHNLHAGVIEVRLPSDLARAEALILPGGESTTLSRLLTRWDLRQPIIERARERMPVWGTCAGAILLAKQCDDAEIEGLAMMDISIRRNAFGRQIDSFETDLDVLGLGPEPFRGVFIRAPKIVAAGGSEILAVLDDGSVVAAREDHLLATTFHPELTPDLRFHALFLDMVVGAETTLPANIATMD